jgi:hypothetical protein
MADRDDDEKFDKGQEKQALGGQQGQSSEYGAQGNQADGSAGQPIGGNDSNTGSGTTLTQGAEFGHAQRGTGSAPPRSMGTHGDEFGQMSDYDRSGQQGQSGTGQADLGSQAGSTLAGRSDQQDLGGVDQPASVGGASGRQGEGFMAQQGSGSDDLQQRAGATSPSSEKATAGSDFAKQGRGALDDDEEAGEGHPS